MGMLLGRREPRRSDDEWTREDRINAYLTGGRITVHSAAPGSVRAVVRGMRGTYQLGYETERGWFCSCGSTGSCGHLTALQMITNPR